MSFLFFKKSPSFDDVPIPAQNTSREAPHYVSLHSPPSCRQQNIQYNAFINLNNAMRNASRNKPTQSDAPCIQLAAGASQVATQLVPRALSPLQLIPTGPIKRKQMENAKSQPSISQGTLVIPCSSQQSFL